MTDVIFVPGLPASELYEVRADGSTDKFFPKAWDQIIGRVDPAVLGPDDLANDPDPVVAGDPISRVKVLFFDIKQAYRLYRILEDDCGLREEQIQKVGWDWRRPVDDDRAQAKVREAILAAPLGSVLLAHSTGGLVVRALLTKEPGLCERLSAVVAMGVPWRGLLKPLSVLRMHERPVAASRANARRVLAHSWAAIDLLPREVANLTISGNGRPYDLFASTNWLPSSPAYLRRTVAPKLTRSKAQLGDLDPTWALPVPLYNVAGFGERTIVKARIVESRDDVEFNVDGSGNPLDDDTIHLGDGTVPFTSATAAAPEPPQQVHTLRIPIGAYLDMGKRKHSALWSNPGCVELLQHLCSGAARKPLVELALDPAVYDGRAPVRLSYSLFDADGSPRAGSLEIKSPADEAGQTQYATRDEGWGMFDFPQSFFRETGGGQFRRIEVQLQSGAEATAVSALVRL